MQRSHGGPDHKGIRCRTLSEFRRLRGVEVVNSRGTPINRRSMSADHFTNRTSASRG
jgi:hypothetical protein